jgi:rubrerythrin
LVLRDHGEDGILGKNVEADYYVCRVCGYAVGGEPQDKCPVRGAPKASFKKID